MPDFLMKYLWKMVLAWLLKNWKTTLTGALTVALTKTEYGRLFLEHFKLTAADIIPYLIGLVALFAKDADKTNSPVPDSKFSSNVVVSKPVELPDPTQIDGG